MHKALYICLKLFTSVKYIGGTFTVCKNMQIHQNMEVDYACLCRSAYTLNAGLYRETHRFFEQNDITSVVFWRRTQFLFKRPRFQPVAQPGGQWGNAPVILGVYTVFAKNCHLTALPFWQCAPPRSGCLRCIKPLLIFKMFLYSYGYIIKMIYLMKK